jgi:NADPH:quinone reductase
MRAIEAETFSGYGGLRETELPEPRAAKDRVLVHVTAAGVTPLEYIGPVGWTPSSQAAAGAGQ